MIIKLRWQRGFSSLSLSPTVPVLHSRQVFQITLCLHRADVNNFMQVSQNLQAYMLGSIEEPHL